MGQSLLSVEALLLQLLLTIITSWHFSKALEECTLVEQGCMEKLLVCGH